MSIRIRLTILSFMQYAVWGAYLTSMGGYLARVGLGGDIRWFYSVPGIVSLFMPALFGVVADRWMQGQKLLALSHLLSALLMLATFLYAVSGEVGGGVAFPVLFSLYALSVVFFMPTVALANAVAYSALDNAGIDKVKAFPPIRLWGTVGFVASMWVVDIAGWQLQANQFGWSAALGIVLAGYALTLPACPVTRATEGRSLYDAFGLSALALFRDSKMARFLLFSVLLGCCLHISNGYVSPFIHSYAADSSYVGAFGVEHANILISISQISEAFCILLIPYFFSRFGIKRVMLIAMIAWAMRFGLLAIGDPRGGVWLFVLSMVVYGVAFDFFNISGSLFVAKEADRSIRSSAQGLFMMMTNGIGASVGMLVAGEVVNRFTTNAGGFQVSVFGMGGWHEVWLIFACYALLVAVAFVLFFRDGGGKGKSFSCLDKSVA